MRGFCCFLVILLVSFSAYSQKMMPKNIIFMIGDGMGFEQVKAAGMYLNGEEGTLFFESMPVKSEVTTKSADSDVTDSAAAATAMATGVKVNNQVVSIALPGYGKDLKTIVEFFKENGKLTGILTNSYLNDATPACFSGHARKRGDFEELSNSMMKTVHPNLLFGGGCKGMSPALLKDAGYSVATDLESMEKLSAESKYWAGLFGSSMLPFEKDGDFSKLPHLSQMVKKALALLDNDNGFFIMIEGGLIDKAGHGNKLEANIGETIEVSTAVKTVMDWAKDRNDTLVIVTADHETGGLTVVKNNGKDTYPEVTWKSKGHSGVNVPLYVWGKNSEAFGKTIDNTDFFKIITAWEETAGRNIRFGIVTDPHYADTDTGGSRFYRESLEKMRECVDKMNEEKVDFLVELGDFKDQGKPASEEKTIGFLQAIENEFAKFAGPKYHVLGNHDQDSISKKAFLENVENTGIPKDKSYYSFVKNGIQFIVLDANFKKDGTAYDRGNFDWKDSNIPKEELAWLSKTLSEHNGKSIVFVHQRLDGDTAECVKNSAEVRKVLSDSGKVLSVFSGHDHKGGLNKLDGIHYYTIKAMIEKSGPENNSYAIVEVMKDSTLKVIGFRKADSAELK